MVFNGVRYVANTVIKRLLAIRIISLLNHWPAKYLLYLNSDQDSDLTPNRYSINAI